jgi:hypothetical protein
VAKFEKGNPGKPKGAQNKLTKTVKECVLDAFNELQKDPKANLLDWGKKNPAMFYQIAAKLIPAELNIKDLKTITVITPSKK